MCYMSFSGPFCSSLFECVLCFKDEVVLFDAKIFHMGQYGSITFKLFGKYSHLLRTISVAQSFQNYY